MGETPVTRRAPSQHSAPTAVDEASSDDDEADYAAEREYIEEALGVAADTCIPGPLMRALQPCWVAVRDFDMTLLQRYQLQTIERPPYYLRSGISCQVMLLVDQLSPTNNNKSCFNQDAWDLSLRLKVLLAVFLFQYVPEAQLKKRAKQFAEGKWQLLADAATEVLQVVREARPHLSAADLVDEFGDVHAAQSMEKLGKRAEKYIRVGEIRKAKNTLTSPVEFAANTADNYNRLLAKHPRRLEVNGLQELLGEDFQVDEADKIVATEAMVWKAIMDASKGAAPGVDGMRYDLFYYMGEDGTAGYIKPLTAFINVALSGALPRWYYSLLASANLIKLCKGENDIRPIAMGSICNSMRATQQDTLPYTSMA